MHRIKKSTDEYIKISKPLNKSQLNDFDKVDKDFLKKKLEYKEFSVSQQSELFGLSLEEMKKVLSEMKNLADQTYRNKQFAQAIELYLKGMLYQDLPYISNVINNF